MTKNHPVPGLGDMAVWCGPWDGIRNGPAQLVVVVGRMPAGGSAVEVLLTDGTRKWLSSAMLTLASHASCT